MRTTISMVAALVALMLSAPVAAAERRLPPGCANEVAAHPGGVVLDLRSDGNRVERTVAFDRGRLVEVAPSTGTGRVVCSVDAHTFRAFATDGAVPAAPWTAFVVSFGILALAVFGVAAAGLGVGPPATLARDDVSAEEPAGH